MTVAVNRVTRHASFNKAELPFHFCSLPTPCRSLRPAVLSESSNVWIFQAIYSHTPLLAHWSTKIKISVHAFLCCIIDKGWANPPFVCRLYFSCHVLVSLLCRGRRFILNKASSFHVCKASVMMNVVTTQTTMSWNWRRHINRIQEESVHKITAHNYGPSDTKFSVVNNKENGHNIFTCSHCSL